MRSADSEKLLRAMRTSRLDVLEEWMRSGILIKWTEAPRVLREAELVSAQYGMRHLEMDLWYLRREYGISAERELEETEVSGGKILFHIVLRSLMDLKAGRPCDMGIWRGDFPTDFCACTGENHLCAESAESYLLQLDPEAEEYCNLSAGKIRDLVRQIKKDPIFTIGSLINGEPTSFVALRSLSLR